MDLNFGTTLLIHPPEQKRSDTSGENAGALKMFQYAAWFVLVFSICAQVQTSKHG